MYQEEYESPRKKPFVLYAVIIILVIGLGYLVIKRAFPPEPPKPPTPTPEVSVYEVKPADISLSYEYSGRTNGSREVEIRARVSGILLKRAYTEGQKVKQGDLLFVIDQEPFKATLAQAQARANQAESDWRRVEELFKQKAVSAREYDSAKALYEQTKAESQTNRINLGYTTVTAPITGVTSKEGLSEGSLVTADTSLLTKISQLDPMYVNFAFPDAEEMSLRQQVEEGKVTLPDNKMLKAEIHFGDGTVYQQEGEISFTDSIIDPQTGTVSARAVLPNKEGKILPGQFVRVIVKGITKPNAIAVPDQAVLQSPQGMMVFVVDQNGKAQPRPITIGSQVGKSRIIETGLQAGDKVIYEGMMKVKPDTAVKIAAPVNDKPSDGNANQSTSQSADKPIKDVTPKESKNTNTTTKDVDIKVSKPAKSDQKPAAKLNEIKND